MSNPFAFAPTFWKSSISLSLCTLAAAAPQGASEVLEESGYLWLDLSSRVNLPADLDGDGDQELVGWWSYWSDYGPVQIFFWDQDPVSGTWAEQEDTFGSNDAFYPGTDAAIGDFDGDGKDEMALLHRLGIDVYEPDANGVPDRTVQLIFSPYISWGLWGRDSAVLDFDGDGRDDLVMTSGSHTSGFNVYLFRSVPGGFDMVETYATASGPLKVACADVMGDPRHEVLVLERVAAAPLLHVFDVDGAMQLQSMMSYGIEPGAGGQSGHDIMLAPGDVDSDGDVDVVLFGAGGRYQLLRNEASGYTVNPPALGGPATDLVDINDDGHLDGICCGSGGGNFLYNNQPATFEICMGDGTGNFDLSVQFEGLGAEHVTGALDFDGDGDTDVLAGRVVLLNKANLGYTYCWGEPNSSGQTAVLRAGGSSSIAAGGPSFTAAGLPPSTFGMLIAGRMDDAGDVNNLPYYDGTLCVVAPLARLQVAQSDAGGFIEFGGMSSWSWAPWAIGTSPDKKFGYQVWYRDPAAGLSGANFSSAAHLILVE